MDHASEGLPRGGLKQVQEGAQHRAVFPDELFPPARPGLQLLITSQHHHIMDSTKALIHREVRALRTPATVPKSSAGSHTPQSMPVEEESYSNENNK